MGIGITEYDKKGNEIIDDFEIDTTGFDVEEKEVGHKAIEDNSKSIEQRTEEKVTEEQEAEKQGPEEKETEEQEAEKQEPGEKVIEEQEGEKQELGEKEIEGQVAEEQEPGEKETEGQEVELDEKCACLVIEPQPDGKIKTQDGRIMTNELNPEVEKELRVTQENVFRKDAIAALANDLSLENEPFANAQVLSDILNRAGVNYDRSKNIIVEEPGVKTVYFPNGEMMQIDAEINDLGDMSFIMNAKNPEELKDTIDQINARDGRDNPMKEAPVQEQTQSREERAGMDMGDR